MRAKIVVDVNLKPDEIRTQFAHIDNCSVHGCETNDKTGYGIFERVAATIAMQDRQKAEAGAAFTFTHPLFESEGLVSIEDGHYVVRVLNEGISALKASCGSIVKYIGNYCELNNYQISFPSKISILEMNGRKSVIDGKILVLRKDRWREARKQKFIEFIVSIGGTLVFLFLALITLLSAWTWQDQTQRPWFLAWVLDILSKLIGSVAVTTLLSFVVLSATLWNLTRHTIKWEIPETGGTD